MRSVRHFFDGFHLATLCRRCQLTKPSIKTNCATHRLTSCFLILQTHREFTNGKEKAYIRYVMSNRDLRSPFTLPRGRNRCRTFSLLVLAVLLPANFSHSTVPIMSWRRPIAATATGAAITFGSTLLSVSLALEVEKAGHRCLYAVAPHKYANVEQAYGLTEEQLRRARNLEPPRLTAPTLLATSCAAADLHKENVLTFD